MPVADGVSKRHSNVAPTSSEENWNACAVVFTGPLGPLLSNVSGGPVSTVKLRVAGVGSGLPDG